MPAFEFFKKQKKSLFSEVVERETDEKIKRKYDSAKSMFLESQKYFWSHYVPKEVHYLIEATAKTIEKKEHQILGRNGIDKNIIYHFERDWSDVNWSRLEGGISNPKAQEEIAQKSFVWTMDENGNSPDYRAIVEKLGSGLASSRHRVHIDYFWAKIREVIIQYSHHMSDQEGFGFNLEIGPDWFVLYDYSQDRNLSLPYNKDRTEPDQSHLILRYDPFKAGLLFPGIQLGTVAHFSEWLESSRKETLEKLEKEARSAFWAKHVNDPKIRDNPALWPQLDEVKFHKEWDVKEKEILENSQANFIETLRNEVNEMIDSRSYYYQISSKSQT